MGFRLRERRAGEYLGTVVDGDWNQPDDSHRLQPGRGDWMLDDYGLVFYTNESRMPIVIPFADMLGVQKGVWKMPGWERENSVKIGWAKGAFASTFPRPTDGRGLCSGFSFSSDPEIAEQIIGYIRSNILDLSAK